MYHGEDIPSDIGYKDQSLNPDQLRLGERFDDGRRPDPVRSLQQQQQQQPILVEATPVQAISSPYGAPLGGVPVYPPPQATGYGYPPPPPPPPRQQQQQQQQHYGQSPPSPVPYGQPSPYSGQQPPPSSPYAGQAPPSGYTQGSGGNQTVKAATTVTTNQTIDTNYLSEYPGAKHAWQQQQQQDGSNSKRSKYCLYGGTIAVVVLLGVASGVGIAIGTNRSNSGHGNVLAAACVADSTTATFDVDDIVLNCAALAEQDDLTTICTSNFVAAQTVMWHLCRRQCQCPISSQ